MEIIVNGRPVEISATSVSDLLIQLGIDPTRVMVERNLEIVPKKMQESVSLDNGDRIEIIHFVGGS
jgi:sulfur carrier protein